jgi:hypothetical protein
VATFAALSQNAHGGSTAYSLIKGRGGGNVVIQAGESTAATGGAVSMTSGYGRALNSGAFSIRTAKAGSNGVSGMLHFSTGDQVAAAGGTDYSTGAIVLRTGSSLGGRGGNISIAVGQGNTARGGDVKIAAGESTAATGGAVSMVSGYGRAKSSGAFSIRTAKSGSNGVSGSLTLSTGAATEGSSGRMWLRTGNALKGAGGSVRIQPGSGTVNGGGRVTISAGESTTKTGGAISMVTGYGSTTSSGAFSIKTANAGNLGVSGQLSFKTGTSNGGASGAIILRTGAATNGIGGGVSIIVGSSGGSGNHNGGNVHMQAGAANSGGADGNVIMDAPGSFIVDGTGSSTGLQVNASTAYFRTAGSLTLTGNHDDAANKAEISLAASGAVQITGSGAVSFTTTSSSADMFELGVESSGASSTVKISGKTFFANGIGFGSYTGSGAYAQSPLLYYMAQGRIDFFDSYCAAVGSQSNDIKTALGSVASYCNVVLSGGGVYMQARASITQPTGGWESNTYFKSFVTPPARLGTVKYNSGASATSQAKYSCAPYDTTDTGSALQASQSICPVVWMNWVSGNGNNVYNYLRIMNVGTASWTAHVGSGTCSDTNQTTEAACDAASAIWTPEWEWQFLVFAHRCFGSTTSLNCYSNYA